MAQPTRIVIADDHPLVRMGIGATLNAQADLELVGEAVDAHEARELCLRLRPDVLLLDLSMPGPAPTDTVTYLREHCSATKVVVLTAYDDEAYVRGLLAVGVRGYILKDEMPETVVRAVQAVARGDSWFSVSLLKKLARRGTLDAQQTTGIELSDRELRILQLAVWGRTDREIGEEIFISERGVRYHLGHIYDKLGVTSRVEAVAQAVQLGLAEAQERRDG